MKHRDEDREVGSDCGSHKAMLWLLSLSANEYLLQKSQRARGFIWVQAGLLN